MAISGAGGVAGIASGENLYESSSVARKNALKPKQGKVDQRQFLKLLTTQLTNQDPLNPIKDTAFVSQMAQLQTLDEQVRMTKELSGMRLEGQLQTSSAMIGKQVIGTDKDGKDASGIVYSTLVRDGKTFVELANKQRIPLGNVTDVMEATPATVP